MLKLLPAFLVVASRRPVGVRLAVFAREADGLKGPGASVAGTVRARRPGPWARDPP